MQTYKNYLEDTFFPPEETQFLVNGFSCGFDLGYRGPRDTKVESRNMKLRVGSKAHLWNMVMTEVKEKRYAGPFEECPFENFIQSPLGKQNVHSLFKSKEFNIKDHKRRYLRY